jgi:TPR repeat protein
VAAPTLPVAHSHSSLVANAEVALGIKYESGIGVPQDYAKALHYYQLSAAQGNALGENDLGFMYEHGNGVPQNYAKALHYYQLAAAQGDADAAAGVARLSKLIK